MNKLILIFDLLHLSPIILNIAWMERRLWDYAWGFLRNVSPPADFLTDVVAFESVIIGLAIPLSFEIITRISERYESDIVTNNFTKEMVIKWLPFFLVGNIILAVVMKFFHGDSTPSSCWKVFAWLSLFGFGSTTVLLFCFLHTLKRYMVDRKFLLDKLFNAARNSIS